MKTSTINRLVHVKTGDMVYIISGKEKGKKGKILKVLRNKNNSKREKVKRGSALTQKN